MEKSWMTILVIVFLLAACGVKTEAPAPGKEITVFAAASLREVMTAISAEWKTRKGQSVRLQFDASSTLARQIREGAPADVFVSAAPEWVDEVSPTSRYDWLGNRLVVVVHKNAPDADLQKMDSLALAGEQVPAGKYARAALAHMHIQPPTRTIYGANVRDVLSKVSKGGAMLGIVYATDAAIDPEVRVSYTFPPESHPRIVYTAGLMTQDGAGFFETLKEPWAVEIAQKYGFTGAE